MPIDVPMIGVSFKQTFDDYREVVFQTHVPQSCSPEQLNDVIDKLSQASERQKSKAHLPTLLGFLADKQQGKINETKKLYLATSELEVHDSLMKRMSDDAESGGRRSWRPTSAQTNARALILARIATSESTLMVLEKEIVIAERQIKDAKNQIAAEG